MTATLGVVCHLKAGRGGGQCTSDGWQETDHGPRLLSLEGRTRARRPDSSGNKKSPGKHKELAASLEKKLQGPQGRARAGANSDTGKRDLQWPLCPAG